MGGSTPPRTPRSAPSKPLPKRALVVGGLAVALGSYIFFRVIAFMFFRTGADFTHVENHKVQTAQLTLSSAELDPFRVGDLVLLPHVLERGELMDRGNFKLMVYGPQGADAILITDAALTHRAGTDQRTLMKSVSPTQHNGPLNHYFQALDLLHYDRPPQGRVRLTVFYKTSDGTPGSLEYRFKRTTTWEPIVW